MVFPVYSCLPFTDIGLVEGAFLFFFGTIKLARTQNEVIYLIPCLFHSTGSFAFIWISLLFVLRVQLCVMSLCNVYVRLLQWDTLLVSLLFLIWSFGIIVSLSLVSIALL